MARLPIYQPNESTNLPALQGSDPSKAAILGEAIAGFGATVADIGAKIKRHDELIETSTLAANAATLTAYHTIQWQKYKQNADPADPEYHNLAQKFMDDVVNPNIEALGQNISTAAGKADYNVKAAEMRRDMAITTSADQIHLTGDVAKQDAITVRNSTSTGVYNSPDSVTFNAAITTADREGDRLRRAGVPDAEARQWAEDNKSGAAQARVKGAAKLNPDKAQSLLDSGEMDKYLTGEQKSDLTDYITRTKRAQDEDKRTAENEKRRQDADEARATAADISASLIDPQTGGIKAPGPDFYQRIVDYSHKPGAEDSTVRAMESAGRQAAKDITTVSDPYTHDSFMQRAWKPKDDPTQLSLQEVDQAFGAGKLSKADYAFFHKSVLDAAKDPKAAEQKHQMNIAMGGYKRFITQSNMLTPDAYGDERWADFQRDKTRQFQAGIDKGLTPEQMTTEGSKDYIFGDVKKYEPPNSLRDLQDQLQGKGLSPMGPVRVVPWANAPAYQAPPKFGNTNSTLPKWDGKEPLDQFLQRAK